MRRRINNAHMLNGVKMIDPAATYIDADVKIAAETVIYPGAVLEGATVIEQGAYIGTGVYLKNVHVCAGAKIMAYTVASDARVGAGTEVGPFACLRMGAAIGEQCRIGNYVEVKNSTVGNGSKAAHLAYIGDAEVGKNVNYGCGAITANYDGSVKERTIIGDNAFVGSNVNLVAPVEVGEKAYIAAGSTINKTVPPGSLAIARTRQEIKPNWDKDPRNKNNSINNA
jgi:bifunctional UDP-N-acetylglucosamine pyrophosphorylase/glucosamine-1-phosphate N-acetyltransferase